MLAIVKVVDDYLQCLVYADDLAICNNNLCAIQQSIDRLYKYCSDNYYLGINIGKTKIMKFRRGGYLAISDVITSGVEIALIRLSGLSKNLSGQVDCPTEVIRRASR